MMIKISEPLNIKKDSTFHGVPVTAKYIPVITAFFENKGAIVTKTKDGDLEIKRGWALTYQTLNYTEEELSNFASEELAKLSSDDTDIAVTPKMTFMYIKHSVASASTKIFKQLKDNKNSLGMIAATAVGFAAGAMSMKFKQR